MKRSLIFFILMTIVVTAGCMRVTRRQQVEDLPTDNEVEVEEEPVEPQYEDDSDLDIVLPEEGEQPEQSNYDFGNLLDVEEVAAEEQFEDDVDDSFGLS